MENGKTVLQPVDEKPSKPTVEANSRQKLLRYAGPIIALALIGAASFVLWQMITSISLADVKRAIVDMEPWRIATAFVLTGVGLAALATYDVVALQVIRTGLNVSFGRAVVGGLVANIFANSLGFPLLSSGSARYRIYSMVGAGLPVVGRLIVMSWVTMWAGILFVVGLTLVFEPMKQDSVFGHHLIDRGVGVLLIVGLVTFVIWAGRKRRAFRIAGRTLRLPGAGPALGMILAGSVDLMAAAGTLYVLLPPGSAPDLAVYMVTYSIGLVAGMMANTPGGIGVFEAAIVTGLGIGDRPDVAAALILFRLIYFLVPLVIGIGLLGIVEIRHRRRIKREAAGAASKD